MVAPRCYRPGHPACSPRSTNRIGPTRCVARDPGRTTELPRSLRRLRCEIVTIVPVVQSVKSYWRQIRRFLRRLTSTGARAKTKKAGTGAQMIAKSLRVVLAATQA
jgi:hypothetical protein